MTLAVRADERDEHLVAPVADANEPEAHTVSEGFSSTLRTWEERCYWNDGSEGDTEGYEHYLSRSGRPPTTYHLSECVGRQCQFGLGINAEHARSIIQMTLVGVAVGAALALVALLIPWLPDAASEQARIIDSVYWLVTVICVAIFAIVAPLRSSFFSIPSSKCRPAVGAATAPGTLA